MSAAAPPVQDCTVVRVKGLFSLLTFSLDQQRESKLIKTLKSFISYDEITLTIYQHNLNAKVNAVELSDEQSFNADFLDNPRRIAERQNIFGNVF